MKTKADVVKALLAGATGQPNGKYVEVLAEDLVIALSAEQNHSPVTNDDASNPDE